MNDREQFEAWAEANAIRTDLGAWEAWQAARVRNAALKPSPSSVGDAISMNKQTDLSKRLRAHATGGAMMATNTDNALLLAAADEIDRYYTGMLNWKVTAEAKDRTTVPIGDLHAAIMALPLPEPTVEGSVMHPELKICYRAPVHFTADQMRELLASAASLAASVQAAEAQVPEGWKLVPRTMTDEQAKEVVYNINRKYKVSGPVNDFLVRAIWEWGIFASPQAQSADQESGNG
jgi:hypothetical protein